MNLLQDPINTDVIIAYVITDGCSIECVTFENVKAAKHDDYYYCEEMIDDICFFEDLNSEKLARYNFGNEHVNKAFYFTECKDVKYIAELLVKVYNEKIQKETMNYVNIIGKLTEYREWVKVLTE